MGKSQSQTIGYRYRLGMHMVLCHGPIDYVSIIKSTDKIAWEGKADGNMSISIDRTDLFGGDEKEGGIQGNVDILMGGQAQQKNNYLRNILGDKIPGYRGVVSAVLKNVYLGTSPYIKPWSFRGTRVLTSTNGNPMWYLEKASIDKPAGTLPASISYNLNTFNYLHSGDPGYPSVDSYHPKTLLIGPFPEPRIISAGPGGAQADDRFIFNGVEYGDGESNFVFYSSGHEFFYLPQNTVLSVNVLNTKDPESVAYGTLVAKVMDIPQPDMNPAHIIRECLTDPNWGMGYLPSDIDDTSFMSAADTLYDEGMGISLIWDKSKTIEDFVMEVVRHIDAALYVSPITGKFILKLIRDDYDENSLIVLDESNISRITNPNRPSFGELSNSVTVKFWNYGTGKDDSVNVVDTALAQMQGQVIDAVIQYPGFTHKRNAIIAAQRDLKSLSTSFFSCTIFTNQVAKDLNVGDVFKLTWNTWNIHELVMRVTEVAVGDGKVNTFRITCSEDIFATTQDVVVEDSGTAWVDPSGFPTPLVNQMVVEAPYFELTQTIGQSTTDDNLTLKPEVGHLMSAAAGNSGAINASMWVDEGSGYEENGILDFCPYGSTLTELWPTDTEISLTSFSNLDEVVIGSYAQIGTTQEDMELVRVDSVDAINGTVTVGRGCLDTPPKIHSAGSKVFFSDLFKGFSSTEYIKSESVDVKLSPITGKGSLDIIVADSMTLTFDQRAYRPYAPGDLQINSLSYPKNPVDGSLTISWADRDRTYQTTPDLHDHTFGNIGPEVGVTYRLQGYVDGVLVTTVEPATSGLMWSPDEGIVKIEVHAKRDGVYSLQPASHEFYHTGSDVRLIETSDDVRSTEYGLTRITED